MSEPLLVKPVRMPHVSGIVALVVAFAALGVAVSNRGPTTSVAEGTSYTPGLGRAVTAPEISRVATEVPPPITRRTPAEVEVKLTTDEVVAEIEPGITYEYWTFNGQVPGPMLRMRMGDTMALTLENPAESAHLHSIDLHAVTGPGGGKGVTEVAPGETKSFRFKARAPGIYVYHCASEHIPSHISNGMYGLILVEPEGGMTSVDRELYVMQGELYPKGTRAQQGHHDMDLTKMRYEQPEYVVFNGRPGSLTGDRSPTVKTGERVRIYFGVGGPNLTSSFHAIGEIFDLVAPEGALRDLHRDVQTTLVPAGGATMVEFGVEVPGTYILVDHALNRALDKGALATIIVTGKERPDIFFPPSATQDH